MIKKPSTQERLQKLIATILSKHCKTVITYHEVNIYPAKGYWRHTKADVMCWTGDVKINNVTVDIGCWNTMTDCVKHGMRFKEDTGYARFEFYAKGD